MFPYPYSEFGYFPKLRGFTRSGLGPIGIDAARHAALLVRVLVTAPCQQTGKPRHGLCPGQRSAVQFYLPSALLRGATCVAFFAAFFPFQAYSGYPDMSSWRCFHSWRLNYGSGLGCREIATAFPREVDCRALKGFTMMKAVFAENGFCTGAVDCEWLRSQFLGWPASWPFDTPGREFPDKESGSPDFYWSRCRYCVERFSCLSEITPEDFRGWCAGARNDTLNPGFSQEAFFLQHYGNGNMTQNTVRAAFAGCVLKSEAASIGQLSSWKLATQCLLYFPAVALVVWLSLSFSLPHLWRERERGALHIVVRASRRHLGAGHRAKGSGTAKADEAGRYQAQYDGPSSSLPGPTHGESRTGDGAK
ncbi:unnamed protein product [Symbiodinium natans]|uniref:Uncharacterized protein n=1 Tax=Symbiodinium natans TaxID=878477 RepID=A0A812Q4D2_9DINO|nr:unnamed protein product [Symbiodinium natans]